MSQKAISVRVRGQEFRVRNAGDEASLQRVADYLEATLARVEERTGTIDSLGVAMLSALNLAREVIELRDAGEGLPPKRLRTLIDMAESALESRS